MLRKHTCIIVDDERLIVEGDQIIQSFLTPEEKGFFNFHH